MCDSRRNDRKVVWPFGSMLLSSTVPRCTLHTESSKLKCLSSFYHRFFKMWNMRNWYCGEHQKHFHCHNVLSWLEHPSESQPWEWRINRSYQERRTKGQLMHPSTLSPFCPTHKHPAIPTPLILIPFSLFFLLNVLDGEKHVFESSGSQKDSHNTYYEYNSSNSAPSSKFSEIKEAKEVFMVDGDHLSSFNNQRLRLRLLPPGCEGCKHGVSSIWSTVD